MSDPRRARDVAIGLAGLLAGGLLVGGVLLGGGEANQDASTGRGSSEVPESQRPPRSDLQAMLVVSVNDGDTLRGRLTADGPVGSEGTELQVRLLEIDTPEVEGPYRDAECFGERASAALKALLPVGTVVYGERDAELRDRFDRTLLYLYLDPAGTDMVNMRMVEGGFARAVLFEPNDLHIVRMRDAADSARSAGLGLWSAC